MSTTKRDAIMISPQEITRPDTLVHLIGNISIAFNDHLIAKEDFYSDENMRLFFGATNVRKEQLAPEEVVIKVENQWLAPDDAPTPNMKFKIVKNAYKVSMRLVFQHRQKSLGLSEVETVFGKEWLASNPIPLPVGWPQGAKRIVYSFEQKNVNRTISVDLDPSRFVRVFSIAERF